MPERLPKNLRRRAAAALDRSEGLSQAEWDQRLDRHAELARIEAAPDAPESLRERVAEAIHNASGCPCNKWQTDRYRRMADAAIAVICTPADKS